MRKASGVWLFLAERVAFVNCLRRAVRSGVHQCLHLRERREQGALASIIVVRAVRAEENHWSIVVVLVACVFYIYQEG